MFIVAFARRLGCRLSTVKPISVRKQPLSTATEFIRQVVVESLEDRRLMSTSALWHFDEISGTSAADSSGNSNTATLHGTAGLVAGHSNNALSLDGAVGDYAGAANASSLNPTSGITVAAWINPTTWGTGANRRIIQKGNSDNQYRLLAENNLLKFDLNGVGSITTALPSTGAWHYVAGTYDGSLMRLYVDGAVVASAAHTGAIHATSDVITIGSKNSSAAAGDFFNGLIDDAEVDDVALSVAQIVANAGGVATTPSTPTNFTAAARVEHGYETALGHAGQQPGQL